MKQWIIWILLLPMLAACNSCSLLSFKSMHPVDAGVPKLIIYYLKDKQWRMVQGHGGDHFKVGDPKVFKIIAPYQADWTLRYLTGDDDEQKQIVPNTKEFLVTDGVYEKTTPTVLGFGLYDEKDKEVINGYFYPNVVEEKNKLRIAYECPYQRTNNNVSSCTRPAAFPFTYSVFIDHADADLIMSTKCSGGLEQNAETQIEKGGVRVLKLEVPTKDFCMVGLATKQGEKHYAHFLYVRFYDPKYSE